MALSRSGRLSVTTVTPGRGLLSSMTDMSVVYSGPRASDRPPRSTAGRRARLSVVTTAPLLRDRYDVVVVGGGPQRPRRRGLPGAGGAVGVRARAGRPRGRRRGERPGVPRRRRPPVPLLVPGQPAARPDRRRPRPRPDRSASRPVASFTPVRRDGRDVGPARRARPRAGHRRVVPGAHRAPTTSTPPGSAFYDDAARLARAVAPTLLDPLAAPADVRARVGADLWDRFVARPIGETIERCFRDDTVRGVVLTDALIGTFASAHDASLRPEPLLPLPRRRQRDGRVAGAGRRHGRGDRRAGAGRPGRGRRPGHRRRGRAGRGRRPGRGRDRATARRVRAHGRRVVRARRGGAGRARPAARTTRADGPGARGRPGEDQHGPRPAAPPAQRARPGRGVRRHVPHRRGLRRARDGLRQPRRPGRCPTRCRARSTATRSPTRRSWRPTSPPGASTR